MSSMSKNMKKIRWNDEELLFPRKALWALLIPIILEQLLNSLMGMVDTMMVSNVGSAAMSAVSLVDSINILVIQVFAALATGAAIICSHYIGSGDKKGANRAAEQTFLAVMVISSAITILCLIFHRPLLHLIFGQVEPEVMHDSIIYFIITVLSYPFISLFNVGGALFRACGNSRFPMRISITSNVLNIVGNAILIFGFHMGVAGAALSTLISRVFYAVVVFYALSKERQAIVLKNYFSIRPDFALMKKILAIGIPSGIENGMFQFGKLAIQSSVSTLGTAAIAAQAMTNILEVLNGIPAQGIGIGLMTVIGQTLGAGRTEEAKYYVRKLTGYAEIGLLTFCLLVFAMAKPVMHLAGMEAESMRICFFMISWITIIKPIFWVLAFVPAYGFRAAGDVKFSMIVSTCSMWIFRVSLATILIRFFGFGPIAVWIGMFTDWGVRGLIFTRRYISGKWLKHQVV